jgi:hypothetical protein
MSLLTFVSLGLLVTREKHVSRRALMDFVRYTSWPLTHPIMIQNAVGKRQGEQEPSLGVASFYRSTLLDSELITLTRSKLHWAGGKWRQTIFGIDPNRSLQRT